jgi:hypothetical protein
MQTGHTFATLMLDGFEAPGWGAKRNQKTHPNSYSPRKKGDLFYV